MEEDLNYEPETWMKERDEGLLVKPWGSVFISPRKRFQDE